MGLKCYRCSLLDVRHKFSTRVMLQSKVRSRPTDVFFIEREGLCLSHTSLLSPFSVSPSSSSLPVPRVLGPLPAYPSLFIFPLFPFFSVPRSLQFLCLFFFSKKEEHLFCFVFFLTALLLLAPAAPGGSSSSAASRGLCLLSPVVPNVFKV